jgi:hypothetical protein
VQHLWQVWSYFNNCSHHQKNQGDKGRNKTDNKMEQHSNAMPKEESKNLVEACIQDMKPKAKSAESEDNDNSLDLNIFERRASWMKSVSTTFLSNEYTKMCKLFSFYQIKSTVNDHDHDRGVDTFRGLKHERMNNDT